MGGGHGLVAYTDRYSQAVPCLPTYTLSHNKTVAMRDIDRNIHRRPELVGHALHPPCYPPPPKNHTLGLPPLRSVSTIATASAGVRSS